MKQREVPPAVRQAFDEFVAAARKYVAVCEQHGIETTTTGRKPLLQTRPKITNDLCELLADSVSIRTSCEIVGIAPTSFHIWCARGETGEEPYAEFLHRTTRARAESRVHITREIMKAGRKDWRALAWTAEHCHADEFCPPETPNVQQWNGKGLRPFDPSVPPTVVVRTIDAPKAAS